MFVWQGRARPFGQIDTQGRFGADSCRFPGSNAVAKASPEHVDARFTVRTGSSGA
jgi:hypothetical protein